MNPDWSVKRSRQLFWWGLVLVLLAGLVTVVTLTRGEYLLAAVCAGCVLFGNFVVRDNYRMGYSRPFRKN